MSKKENSSPVTRHPSRSKKVALLWDESFLWGLMAYKALNAAHLPFELIRSEEIRKGKLKDYKMLFVPGGWASNKLKSLGDKGVNELKKFVRNGGNYLGFCGGAGLATLDGIGLLGIKRKPTKERVPSFSGGIQLNIKEHPVWHIKKEGEKIRSSEVEKKTNDRNLSTSQPLNFPTSIFHAWWPSQFLIEDKKIKVLATYGNALPDSFSSDLNVGDVEANGNWEYLENVYGINLDPKRLLNDPAVVEGTYGRGKVVLSLIHFDTPEDANGQVVLRNLWEYLNSGNELWVTSNEIKESETDSSLVTRHSLLINEFQTAVAELISLGERNFLWFWRNPLLLQWRRGVRGLEYCTLYVMIKEIAGFNKEQRTKFKDKKIGKIKNLLLPFTEKAKRLLLLERHALQKGHINYERCDDAEIQEIRTELFSAAKSHGGMFKELIDEIDEVLFKLIK